tara:strand:+ start:32 stop:202 length:171 start_codon:yes stop_codon:yes gene_type:complete
MKKTEDQKKITMDKVKEKTYKCIEHGEIFYIGARDMQQAIEYAQDFGGSVIKEIKQ